MALTPEQIDRFRQLSEEVEVDPPRTSPAERNLLAADGVDPDDYARKHELSRKTGVPVPALDGEAGKQVERSQETKTRIDRFREMADDVQVTKAFVEDPTRAIVSQDDLVTLAAIEREANRAWYELDERTFENWGTTSLMGMGKTWDQAAIAYLEEVKGIGEKTFLERTLEPTGMGLTPMGMMQNLQESVLAQAMEKAAGGEDEFEQWKTAIGQRIDKHKQNLEFAEQEIGRLTPEGLTVMEEGLRGGLQMIADMAPGLGISIASRGRFNPTLGYLTGKTWLDSYGSAITSGKSHETSKAYASIDAVIEFATERIPTKRLEAIVGELGGTGLKSSVKRWLAGEALGEQAATFAQSMNAYAFELDEELAGATDFWEALDIQARRQAVTFISTLAGGGSMAGTIKGVDYLANRERRAMAKVLERTQQYRGSEAEQERIDNLVYLAQSSKTNERSKEMFDEFITKLDEKGGEKKIYMDPAVMGEWVFADLGAIPDSMRKQLDASGGMIEMSLATFMTEFAPDEKRMELVRPFIKTSENLYTKAEMESDETNEFIKTLLSSAAKAQETKSQADEIAEDLIRQIVATGRQTEATARQSVAVTTAQIVVQYEFLKKSGFKKEDGSEVTLQELYEDFGLRIAKPEEKVGTEATPREFMSQLDQPAYLDAPAAFETMRDSFLDKLPEDADHADLMDNIEKFSTEQRNVLKALARNDWLGFDYPAQAINAAFSGEIDNYEVSAGLKQAIGRMVNKELGFSPAPRVLRQQNFGNMAVTETVIDEDGMPLDITESADVLWFEHQQRLDNVDALRRCFNG
jgi:hypothetical protein